MLNNYIKKNKQRYGVCIAIRFHNNIKQESAKDFFDENENPGVVILDEHAYAFF